MTISSSYRPSFEFTSVIIKLLTDISESLGYISALEGKISSDLILENQNLSVWGTLSLDENLLNLSEEEFLFNDITLKNKEKKDEILRVKSLYEAMSEYDPYSISDFLNVHSIFFNEKNFEVGKYRSGGLGIFKADTLLYMAPVAKNVPNLMDNLFKWLVDSSDHPLIKSSLFVYGLENIYPFSVGTRLMGRFWQKLILNSFKSLFAYLPLENIQMIRHIDYFRTLEMASNVNSATSFLENYLLLMLEAINDFSLKISSSSVKEKESPGVSIIHLIKALDSGLTRSSDLMRFLKLSHRHNFRKNYLRPALEQGLITRLEPKSLHSPKQGYCLSAMGKSLLGKC
jgi:Fic family protein